MHSLLETEIRAPAPLVFALVRDPERWPRLLPHYLRARVVGGAADRARTMEFVAARPLVRWLGLGAPVAWRSRTWSDPDTLSVRFLHLGGATDGMQVSWRIVPGPEGCRVSIEHQFDRWPQPYPELVERLFVRPIASRTLATFKALAESLAEFERPSGEPESSADIQTNLDT
jgi:ribosome-associated toxin RatA of RatAB toxin-antitoxin module